MNPDPGDSYFFILAESPSNFEYEKLALNQKEE